MPEYEVTVHVTVPETVLVSAEDPQTAAAEAEYEVEMGWADAVETSVVEVKEDTLWLAAGAKA